MLNVFMLNVIKLSVVVIFRVTVPYYQRDKVFLSLPGVLMAPLS